ncbi:LOW QUALITY PROTEIN: lymphocyte antigen 96 [Phaethornis superciliosus]
MFGLLLFILFTPGVSIFLCMSSDLEISYTFCDSIGHTFTFNLTPCSIVNKSVWRAALTWIPRSDINFLKIVFTVWYNGDKALHWKEILCSGEDDKYAECGAVKGGWCERAVPFPHLGTYYVILQAFSDDSENNMVMCLNITMIVNQYTS